MDDFHFYEEIGRRRSSVIYKGRQRESIRYVAIKSVDKTQQAKVLHEVQVMHRLDHVNCLRFYTWYETRNHIWLILEYCTGGSLYTLLKSDRRLPESAIKVFGTDIVQGLHYMHSNGLLFCDLKPSNILMNEYGVLKLSDFAMARKIEVDGSDEDQYPGAKRGSPFYMAPELLSREGVYSFASEFWSLGCVLYELSIGRPPFTSKSFSDLVQKIQTTPLQLPKHISPAFRDLLSSLLRKDPAKRLSWSSLLTHEFWESMPMPKFQPMPKQPLFEHYLQTRTYIPSCPEEDNLFHGLGALTDVKGKHVGDNGSTLPQLNASGIGISENNINVSNLEQLDDVKRLSMIAKRNLVRESTDSIHASYIRSSGNNESMLSLSKLQRGEKNQHDLHLEHHDTELNFEELDEKQDYEEEGSDDELEVVDKKHIVMPLQVRAKQNRSPPSPVDTPNEDAILSNPNPNRLRPKSAPESETQDHLQSTLDKDDGLSPNDGSRPSSPPSKEETISQPDRPQKKVVANDVQAAAEAVLRLEQEIDGIYPKSAETNDDASTCAEENEHDENEEEEEMEEEAALLPKGFENPTPLLHLLQDSSDVCVRPIVSTPGQTSLPYRARYLPFEALTASSVSSMETKEIQAFLAQVYKALNSTLAPMQDSTSSTTVSSMALMTTIATSNEDEEGVDSDESKRNTLAIHCLGYIYTLSCNNRLANMLINSSLLVLLLKLAKRTMVSSTGGGKDLNITSSRRGIRRKSTTDRTAKKLRGRIAVVLAVLIRHATYIASDLSDQGIIGVLVSFANDPILPIRRFGVAGLGELLFYITTNASPNSSGSNGSTCWKITGSALAQLGRSLRLEEDDTVRQCALKTYENVLSTTPLLDQHSGYGNSKSMANPPGLRFATQDVAMLLLNTAVKARLEDMRGTAAMALAHLVRLNRRILPQLAELEGWGFLPTGLMHGSPRVKQAFVNILSLILSSAAVQSLGGSQVKPIINPSTPPPPVVATNNVSQALTLQTEVPSISLKRQGAFSSPSSSTSTSNANQWLGGPAQLAAERRAREALLGSKSHFRNPLKRALLRMIEHAETLPIRSKALLAITLFLRIYPMELASMCEETKLMQIIDRLYMRLTRRQKDGGPEQAQSVQPVPEALYLRRCLDALIRGMLKVAQHSADTIEHILRKLSPLAASGRIIGQSPSQQAMLQKLATECLPVLVHLCTCYATKSNICDARLVSVASKLVGLCDYIVDSASSGEHGATLSQVNLGNNPSSTTVGQEFERLTMLLVEKLTTKRLASSELVPIVVQELLPALIERLSCDQADSRAQCLRLSLEIFSLYLDSPAIYSGNGTSTTQIDTLIVRMLLPCYRRLVTEAPPIPQMAMRLLTRILAYNPSLVSDLHQLQLIPRLLSTIPQALVTGDSPSSTAQKPSLASLGLVSHILRARVLPLGVLINSPSNLVQRLVYLFDLLDDLCQSSQGSGKVHDLLELEDWFEGVISILDELLQSAKLALTQDAQHESKTFTMELLQSLHPLAESQALPILVRTLADPNAIRYVSDSGTTEKATACLLFMSKLFGNDVSSVLFLGESDHFTNLIARTLSRSSSAPSIKLNLISLIAHVASTDNTIRARLCSNQDLFDSLLQQQQSKTLQQASIQALEQLQVHHPRIDSP